MLTFASAMEIIERLGGDVRNGLAPCPICQPDARPDQRALSIQQAGDRLLMYCHKSGCSFTDLRAALGLTGRSYHGDRATILAAKQERDAEAARKLAKAQRKWDFAKPLAGTKGEEYLRGREITCDLPKTLRWSDDEFHGPSGTWGSAIIGLVEPTGAIHRTHFDKKGNRLRTNSKLMLGSTKGGAVRLSEGQGPLVICEGIETGLSLLSGLLSGPAAVWAALSATGMAGLELPKNAGEMIIAMDGDDAGRNAGSKLTLRATLAGWQVSGMDAPDGQDFNDALRGLNAT